MNDPRETPAAAQPLPHKHLAGTPGAVDVSTRYVAIGLAAISDIIEDGTFGAFAGSPGLSKTFVALTGCEQARVRFRYLEVSTGHVGKQLEVDLTTALYGGCDRRKTRGELQEGIREWFREPGLLALDEAHRLGVNGAETVRYLATGPSNRTAILFVGHDLRALFRRNPALDSRIARQVPFRPLSTVEMLAAVRAYHPFYANATQDLEVVQREYAKGEFRRWAHLLEAGLKVAPGFGVAVLTPAVYRRARQMVGKLA